MTIDVESLRSDSHALKTLWMYPPMSGRKWKNKEERSSVTNPLPIIVVRSSCREKEWLQNKKFTFTDKSQARFSKTLSPGEDAA